MIRERLTTIVRTTRERPALLAAIVLLLVLLAGVAGYWLASRGSEQQTADTSGRRILYWYDPMLPGERYPGPGKSSMGMDLIAKYADEAAIGGVTVSPSVMQNLGIRLARVETRDIAATVRSVGRVDFDQRLINEVQTLTPGFVERLSVRAEGEPIGAGRVIADVYSPELYGAQQEYAALVKIRGTAVTPGLRQAARSRLRLLGLPAAAIQRLERGSAPQRTYPVVARTSGVVTRLVDHLGIPVDRPTVADPVQVPVGVVLMGHAERHPERRGIVDLCQPREPVVAEAEREDVRADLGRRRRQPRVGVVAQRSMHAVRAVGLVQHAELSDVPVPGREA